MASEAQNVRKRNLLCIEGRPINLPKKRSSHSLNENMKEDKESAKHLASCTSRTTVGQTLTSPHPLFKVAYCRRKAHYYSPKPCFRKKQLPKVRGRDMANKENELACAGNLPAEFPPNGRAFLLNSSDAGRSQTESPSSKYSGFFSEVSEDHDTVAQVLFSRNLRLNVALTFWKKKSISELVAYLVRYVIVGLNWLQAVIKRWWSELSVHTDKIEDGTDGSFVVHDIPSGSYVVEVISPAYKFEPVRVDITSRGKMRARYVNYIKTSEVVRLPYPLQMKSSGPPSYFIKRESWGWTDFLMNPMVMMMILPLLIFVLLPKVVNTSDPDMRREMEQSMNMLNSNHELPDVSEFMTRLFSSKSSSKSTGSSSKIGKSGAGKRR
ncbi:hypothetical protein L345_01935 [Ophiophagus hannah]|uniref:ER membrane protein complex subunit 7 n=3 Tax=Elapinae TaxID=42168 RepID=V8PEB4_OPHHA|nr:hypothetical protein L345_01935 [Ophiophagus hannah]